MPAPAGALATIAGANEMRAVQADTTQAFARRAAIAHVVYMPTVERPSQLGARREQDFVQWLADKLGTDIHPPILSRSGYELMGGRLLRDADGEMAMFMYRDAQGRRVTLSISRRKASADTTAFALYRDGPVNVFYWVDGDFGYAVSSGIDRRALLALSHDIHKQLQSIDYRDDANLPVRRGAFGADSSAVSESGAADPAGTGK